MVKAFFNVLNGLPVSGFLLIPGIAVRHAGSLPACTQGDIIDEDGGLQPLLPERGW